MVTIALKRRVRKGLPEKTGSRGLQGLEGAMDIRGTANGWKSLERIFVLLGQIQTRAVKALGSPLSL